VSSHVFHPQAFFGHRKTFLKGTLLGGEQLGVILVGITGVLVSFHPELAGEEVPLGFPAVVVYAEKVVQRASAAALAVLVEQTRCKVGNQGSAAPAKLRQTLGLEVT
jgi:hypothetical protein